jgi:hypothetical protein
LHYFVQGQKANSKKRGRAFQFLVVGVADEFCSTAHHHHDQVDRPVAKTKPFTRTGQKGDTVGQEAATECPTKEPSEPLRKAIARRGISISGRNGSALRGIAFLTRDAGLKSAWSVIVRDRPDD